MEILRLWGRQLKPTETCNDREKPTHCLGTGSCFLFKTCSFNTMGPVETAINNECTDKRPYKETDFVPSPIILKINKLPVVMWLLLFSLEVSTVNININCSCTKITMKSSKGSLFCHQILVYLFSFFLIIIIFGVRVRVSQLRVNPVVDIVGNQPGFISL